MKRTVHMDHVTRIFYRMLLNIEVLLNDRTLKNNPTIPEPIWKKFLILKSTDEKFEDEQGC
jgi:hypothetical protein